MLFGVLSLRWQSMFGVFEALRATREVTRSKSGVLFVCVDCIAVANPIFLVKKRFAMYSICLRLRYLYRSKSQASSTTSVLFCIFYFRTTFSLGSFIVLLAEVLSFTIGKGDSEVSWPALGLGTLMMDGEKCTQVL